MSQFDYRTILKNKFEKRTFENPNYSLALFAEDLKMSTLAISQILNYERGISNEKAEKIAKCLSLGASETELFLLSVQANHERDIYKKSLAKKYLKIKTILRQNCQDIQERRLGESESVMLVINSSDMKAIRDEINVFKESFVRKFAKNSSKNETYCLDLCFFRVDVN